MQLSFDQDHEQQMLKLLEAVKSQFQTCLTPCSYLTLDKFMIKLVHRNLKSKIKLIWKPRPIAKKIKNLSDAAINIALNMKLDDIKEKK